MSDQLPDNLVQINSLRINRNAKLKCTCEDPHYEVDVKNQIVRCTKCEVLISPFAALIRIADSVSELHREVERLYEQRKEIAAYKPYLVVIKKLEQYYRGRKDLPCCPRCNKPFYLENIDTWMNATIAEKRGLLRDDG